MRAKGLLVTVLGAVWAVAAASAAADSGAPATIKADGGTITVIADGVPLREVLYQMREQSGFTLIENGSALQRPVTVNLDDVPWREGLAELLSGVRYVLATDPESSKPTKLVILSSEVSGLSGEGEAGTPASELDSVESSKADPTPKKTESSLEEATRIANELTAQRENPLQYAMRRAREAAAAAKAAQEAYEKSQADRSAAGDSDSTAEGDQPQDAYRSYAESLRALGNFQDPERLDVLAPALDSDNKHVRSAALEALRDGTARDDAVLDRVRSMLTDDADPFVRRDALEVYVRYGSQSEVLSLVQSLGRVDGPTRDIAVREWVRLEKEMADAALADQQLQGDRR